MPLLKTTDELQIVASVDNSLDPATFAPYIIQAEREYLREVIGDTFMAVLQGQYDTSLSTNNANLLPYIHRVIGPLALYHMIPNSSLHISNSGVQASISTDFTPASGTEIYFLRTELRNKGMNALDDLYEFLEDNKSTYTVWAADPVYTQFKKFFISSAAQFEDAGVYISRSRVIFGKLVPMMANMEKRYIQRTLGNTLFADLKTKWAANNLSSEETILVDMLRNAIALFTYNLALMDRNLVEEIMVITATRSENFKKNKEDFADFADYTITHKGLAEAALQDAVAYLNTTASVSVFPLWFNSPSYVDPTLPPSRSDYNNGGSNGSFFAI